MDGSDIPSGQLSHRARVEAALLAVPPAAAAAAWLWTNEPDLGGAVQIGLGLMLLAVPLLAQTRRAFVILSLVIAGLLGLLVALSMVLRLFLFFPAAVTLLAATGVTARKRPARLVARTAAWLLVAATVAGFGLALRSYYFPPSDKILVQLTAPETFAHELRLGNSLQKAGFTGVSVGSWTSARQLAVYAAGLPARQRPHLLQVVRAQPGVVTAYWCQGTQCYI